MSSQTTAEILNKNNLMKAKEVLNNLSKNLNAIIQNISDDLALGNIISTATNDSIAQWFTYLTSIANQTIGSFYYDSGTGIATVQLAFSGKYEGSVFMTNLCTFDLNSVNAILTGIQNNYSMSLGYPVTINADVETIRQMIEQICGCTSKIETILGKYGADCDTSGACSAGPVCFQKNAEINFSYGSASYPDDTMFTVVSDFYFSGSDYYGSGPSQITIVASGSFTNPINSFVAQIVDIGPNGAGTGGSGSIVATITGNYQATQNPIGYTTNVFTNISITPTLWELQIKPNQSGDAVILYSIYIRI